MKAHGGTGTGDLDNDAQRGGIAPGKRARTEAIQRRASGDEVAPGATPGGGNGALLPAPVQAKMADAFDFDFSNVRVHQGAEAPAMGALAYTQGSDVHFAPGQYDPGSARGQELIGHELAHVVQQSEGRVAATTQLKGVGLNDDSALEVEADTWGARAARGESVGRSSGVTEVSGGSGAAVQRFKDFSVSGEEDSKQNTHWAANGNELRVADDGTSAVAQDSIAGSQELYVLAGRLPTINADLKAANAPIKFVKAGGSVSGAPPGDLDQPAKVLDRVKPVEPADISRTKEIPNDCGNAARTVSGAFAEGKGLRAEYVGKDGKPANATYSDPEMMKYEIMVNHFGDKIPNAKTVLKDVEAAIAKAGTAYDGAKDYFDDLNALHATLESAKTETEHVVADFDALKASHKQKVDAVEAAGAADKADQLAALEKDFAKKKEAFKARLTKAKAAYDAANKGYQAFLDKKVGAKTVRALLIEYFDAAKVQNQLIADIMGPYLGMAGGDQEAFDEKVGINRHANPGVGDAYTISSGGDSANPNKSTWNFHWAGVIFKSTTGSDNITMENYAGSLDSDWVLQMYGLPTAGNRRMGQTFQEQHRDVHEQHGKTPTTMSTEKK